MKLEIKGNKNYCATIVKIEQLVPLKGCDNIQKSIILNSSVIVSKDVKVDDIGLFFPLETALTKEFLRNNNLYRDKTLNVDQSKNGFFESNGRIRCVKLKGNASEGFYIPFSALNYIDSSYKIVNVGDEFDTYNDQLICYKYIVIKTITGIGSNKKSTRKGVKKVSILIDDQFRLHYNTSKINKNLHLINHDTLISISDKWHGTSLVSSMILTKKKLTIKDKICNFFGANIINTKYTNIFSSRNVIKNEHNDVLKKSELKNSFYEENIWESANKLLLPKLLKGMTIYAEIVGYLTTGKAIQKGYHYGCDNNTFKVVVYRITMTNIDGQVIEMPFMQMKDYCEKFGLESVPLIFYGFAKDYISSTYKFESEEKFREDFLKKLESEVQGKECKYNPKMPMEGYVIKIDGINESSAFKYKNIDFLEYETKMLDKGEVDIESDEE